MVEALREEWKEKGEELKKRALVQTERETLQLENRKKFFQKSPFFFFFLLRLPPLTQLHFTLSVSIFGQGPLGLAIEQTAEKHGWL